MQEIRRARVGNRVRAWDARHVRKWQSCAFLGERGTPKIKFCKLNETATNCGRKLRSSGESYKRAERPTSFGRANSDPRWSVVLPRVCPSRCAIPQPGRANRLRTPRREGWPIAGRLRELRRDRG